MKTFRELFPTLFTEGVQERAAYLAKSVGKKLRQAVEEDNSAPHGLGMQDPKEIILALAQADPSGGRYLTFITNAYISQSFKFEDFPQVREALVLFNKVRNQLPEGNRDVTHLRKVGDLYKLLRPFRQQSAEVQVPASKRAQKKTETENITKNEINTIVDTPAFKVVVPLTHRASCMLSRADTQWCTAREGGESTFQSYITRGPLYIIQAKINGQKRQFQIHIPDGAFMDEEDSPISAEDIEALSKIPGYKKFLNTLIKEYYPQVLGESVNYSRLKMLAGIM